MAKNDELHCELVYVPQDKPPVLFTSPWTDNMSVDDLIQASGFMHEYPEIKTLNVGIFARRVTWETKIKPGDRVELYRPLQIDPKEKRRRKAKADK